MGRHKHCVSKAFRAVVAAGPAAAAAGCRSLPAKELHVGSKQKAPSAVGALHAATLKLSSGLERQYGVPHAVQLAHALQPGGRAVEALRFGETSLDSALSAKGVKGRIVEVCGDHGWLCSALALQAAGQSAAKDQPVLWLSVNQAEGIVSNVRNALAGQGPGAHYEQLAVETASQAEECLEYMVSTAQSEKYALVLLDSITGLTPFGGDVKYRNNVLPLALARALGKLHVSCGPNMRTTTLLLNRFSRSVQPTAGVCLERWAQGPLDRHTAASIHVRLGGEPLEEQGGVRHVRAQVQVYEPLYRGAAFEGTISLPYWRGV